MPSPLNGYTNLIGWLTIIGLLAGVLAFFDTIHENYVTKDALEIRILELEKEYLLRKMETSDTPLL